MKRIGFAKFFIALSTLFAMGCGGGGGDEAGTGAASGTFQFQGVREVTANDDGTWTVWWSPVFGTTDVKYDVFQRGFDGEHDYSTPIVQGLLENQYVTKDLRLIGNSCFVVRFRQDSNDTDKNTTEICTGHEAYTFDGIEELVSLRGGAYVAKWKEPPFDGAQFQVFSKEKASSEWKPLELTEEPFYKTEPISLDKSICFMVRYRIEGFPEDENTKELCTSSEEGGIAFDGVSQLDSPGKGMLRVSWVPATRDDVAGYNVYLGGDFKQKIGSVKSREESSFTVEDLLHAVVYTVGVRAVDVFGREDENTKVLSYELRNHIPQIAKVEIVPVELNAQGRPVTMACRAEYLDEDDWQTLKPTFIIRNNKRQNLGIVERQVTQGEAAQKEVAYTLDPDDQRSDELYCELKINDGFDESPIVKSEYYKIPDTPVVATGILATAFINNEIDIIITRGSGLGYTDFDKDDAIAIDFNTTNGTMVSENPVFNCIDGTCTGRFKPAKDFFTNTDSSTPEYATVQYRVTAGESTSAWAEVTINVRPVPRALGFDMVAEQDKERDGSVGREVELAGDDIITFAGYNHVLDHDATMLFVRHPLSESEYNGKIQLPTGITADPANGIGCTDLSVVGWAKDGFECGIPCSDGKCPFTFLGDIGYYGPAAFDFAVVVDGIQSNYATARVTVLPNLQATGFNGLTVEDRAFEVRMFETQGFQGAQGGIQITGITITNYTQGISAANVTVPFNDADADGIWTATITPNAEYKGYAKFNYVVNAVNNDAGGETIESNEGEAKIHFYPKPDATNIDIQAVESRARNFNISLTPPPGGYVHQYNDVASEIVIQAVDLGKGFLDDATMGAAATNGTLPCDSGICGLIYQPVAAFFDPDTETNHKKFEYKVRVPINASVFDTAGLVLDPFLEVPANRILESEFADANINVRPVPKASTIDTAVAEYLSAKPSSLSLVVNLGDEFTHAFNYKATAVQLINSPAFGTITDFVCSLAGECSATYTPALNQVGMLTPSLQYTVTVDDPIYQPEIGTQGKITSDPATLNIDVRPMPKPTGLTGAVAENTSFSATNKTISLSLDNGYTHANNLPIVGMTIVEQGTVKGSLGGIACAADTCDVVYTPTVSVFPGAEIIGTTDFAYTVSVNDAKLGVIESVPATYTMDIRPVPRANDFGASGLLNRVLENTAFTFAINPVADTSSGYYHKYSTPAKPGGDGITIAGYTNAVTEPARNCVGGSCTVEYNPLAEYFTPDAAHDYVEYSITIFDDVLQTDLVSNTGKIWIDVYPRPRASSKFQYVLQNQSATIAIDLATGKLADEDGDAAIDRKGYTHRRDHFVDTVNVSGLTRGTLATFVCTDGDCSANFDAPAYAAGPVDEFQYTVDIAGVGSKNTGTFQIQVLPTATVDDLSGILTIEDQTVTIDFDFGSEYNHPLGTRASTIEITEVFDFGNVTIDDLDAGVNNCDGTGKCRVTFTPNAGYFTPEADLANAWFKYRVYTNSPELGTDVPSNVGTVSVIVRPKPKTIGYNTWAIQGDTKPITLLPLTMYTYAWGNGYAKTAQLNSPENGTISDSVLVCDGGNGQCGPMTFTPAVAGEPYYGPGAKFRFAVTIEDPYGLITSDQSEVVIDYRPKPKATGAHFKNWQDNDVGLVLKPNDGYEHAYFGTDPDQYRAFDIEIVSYPGNGTVLGVTGNEFVCDAGTYNCSATFDPESSYYYEAANGYLQVQYIVKVNDPVAAGPIESDPGVFTIELQPVPVPSNKTVYGVQTIPKPVRLAPDDGFVYPGTFTPSVTTSDNIGGFISSPFVCSTGTNICNAVFSPNTSDATGVTSFDFRLGLVDPNAPPLPPYTSSKKTYTVDFYPLPYSQAFADSPGVRFQALEGEDKLIALIPASFPDLNMCDAGSHSGQAPGVGYSHKLCEPAKQVIVTATDKSTFVDAPEFDCDTSGLCTGTLQPNVPGTGWNGYGKASFNFKVRIDPDALSGESLSATEIAALTSNESVAVVEFYPRPYATGVTLEDTFPGTDYLYAVEGEDLPLVVDRCAAGTVALADCHFGYMNGYDDNITGMDVSNKTNLDVIGIGCSVADGRCTATIRPNAGFTSADASDFATFDYSVRMPVPAYGDVSSNVQTIKVQVYPKPMANNLAGFGREGEDLVLTIDNTTGYTHARGELASKVVMTSVPDSALGWFVNHDTDALLPVDGAGAAAAFRCDTGVCTAKFRPADPLPADGADTKLIFKVEVDGPVNMPTQLSDKLVSTNKEYRIRIYPKPKVHNVELVAVEGESTAMEIRQGAGNGYTHGMNLSATNAHFVNALQSTFGEPSRFDIQVNGAFDFGDLDGVYDCSSGTDCAIACVGGNCSANFQGNSGIWTQKEAGCSVADSDCPTLGFKVSLVIPEAGNLYLESDSNATISWNVRPKPRAGDNQISVIAEEGDSVNLTLSNGTGFSHPFYDLKSMAPSGFTNGSLQASPDCLSTPGQCEMVFLPTPGWEPNPGDRYGTFNYNVTVNDPTTRTWPQSGAVGDLTSPDTGTVSIEFRPKPRATGFMQPLAQESSGNTITIAKNTGYTHPYYNATKIVIVPNSQTNLSVDGCPNGTGCTISCTAGNCDVDVTPASGFYTTSTEATFQYHIVVEDPTFVVAPTPRELQSQSPGLASFDIRPLPVADDVTFVTREEEPKVLKFENAPGKGYFSFHGYKAKSAANASLPSDGAITTAFSCVTDSGDPDYGNCFATYTPNNSFFGEDSFTYTITYHDDILGQDLTSVAKTATIKVRPVPKATGFGAPLYVRENQPRSVVIQQGPNGSTVGYFYPDAENLWPKAATVVVDPSGAFGAFTDSPKFLCNTAGAKLCTGTFSPVTDVYGGGFSFDYKVSVDDPFLLSTLESNDFNAPIEIRPIIRAFDAGYTSNDAYKAIQGQDHLWTMANGQLTGFTYPGDPSDIGLSNYSSVLNSLSLSTSGEVNGSLVGVNCSSQTCTGTFDTAPAFHGEASFNFKVSVTDALLGTPLIESETKTITLDFYPLPVANDVQVYTVEGVNKAVQISKGGALGYTHPRNHNAAAISVEGSQNIQNGGSLAFTCNYGTGVCDSSLQPGTGYSSNSSSVGDAAYVDFKVRVDEPGGPRQVLSDNIGKLYLTVYPKPVMSLATLDNTPVWAGEAEPITLSDATGLGYTHSWSHDAAEVSSVVSTNSSITTWTSSGPGVWDASFTAPTGNYGPNQAYADIQVKTVFGSLDDPNVWSDVARLNFNVRPVPTVPATPPLDEEEMENRDINNWQLSLGTHFFYDGDAADIMEIEVAPGGHMICEGGCGTFSCDGAGTCTITNKLVPETDFHRSSPDDGGIAWIDYRVRVQDPVKGSKWSPWSEQRFKLLPRPDGQEGIEFPEGIENELYSTDMLLGTGYTHVENSPPFKIRYRNFVNLNISGGEDVWIDCDAVGEKCDLEITPVLNGSGYFDALTEKDPAQNGAWNKPWGWGKFEYKVQVKLNNIGVPQKTWSTAYVRFYPKPSATNREVVVVEGAAHPFLLNSPAGYSHPLGDLAAKLTLTGANDLGGGAIEVITTQATPGGSMSTVACSGPACDLACSSGNCNASFTSNAGFYSQSSDINDACDVFTAYCPEVDYKVSIQTPYGKTAVSDSTGKLRFNVRPLPDADAHQIFTMVPEGENKLITMTRNVNGYAHPYYKAKSIDDVVAVRGTMQAAFDCSVGADCTATFQPDAGWEPTVGDKLATVTYKVTVTDPTNKTSPETGTVGDIQSAETGTVTLEYRPKPKTTGQITRVLQDSAGHSLVFALNQGYTHEYGKHPKSIIIKANSWTGVDVTNAGCVEAADCEIACSGSPATCTVNFDTDAGFKGAGKFDYRIKITDDGFLPAPIDLISPSSGTATIDVRPLPVAQNLTVHVEQDVDKLVTIKDGVGEGYTHDYSYLANAVTVTSQPVNRNSDLTFSCPPVGDGSEGSCTATFDPVATYFGGDSFNYTVTVQDEYLGNITSVPATITFTIHPVPVTTGFVTSFAIRENQARTLALEEGPLSGTVTGYFYPPSYLVHPSNVGIVTPPDSLLIDLGSSFAWSYTSGATTPRGASAAITPVSGAYGSTSFEYNLAVPNAQFATLTSHNTSVITLDVRPLIYAADSSFTDNPTLLAIEDTPLTFELSNGTGKGFEYPSNPADLGLSNYSSILNTLAIVGDDTVTGANGTFTVSPTCASQKCTGTFLANDEFSGTAKFDYTLSITDASLPTPTISSGPFTATIDVYPRPNGETVVFNTVQGTAFSARLKQNDGAARGYTHGRGDALSNVYIVSTDTANLTSVSQGDVSCDVNGCSVAVSPLANPYSSNATDYTYFEFEPEVTEPAPYNRVARAEAVDKGRANIVVYPKPVADNSGRSPVAVWENDQIGLSIFNGGNQGYNHPWGDKAIEVTPTVSENSVLTGDFACDTAGTGNCTHTDFLPRKMSASDYNPALVNAYIDYDVTVDYPPLADPVYGLNNSEVVSGTPARMEFKVRAVPGAPLAGVMKTTFIENTTEKPQTITGISFTRGDGYTYADALQEVDMIEIRQPVGADIDCTDGTCGTAACSTGTCNVESLTSTIDFDRVDGTLTMEYRVRVTDSLIAGPRWSNWADLKFDLIPRPRGTSVTYNQGVEGEVYNNLQVALDNGYTHSEDAAINRIKILSKTNIASINGDATATPEFVCAGGQCFLDVMPITTAFTTIAGKTPGDEIGKTYGWARIEYEVQVPDVVDVWSTKGVMDIYYRPIPKPEPVAFASGVENENYTVSIRLNDGSTCLSNCGYTHDKNAPATEIEIGTVSNMTLVGSSPIVCDAGGKCDVTFHRVTHGNDATFDYKVTVNGVQQRVWGTGNLTFNPRHRTSNVLATTLEGVPININVANGPAAGYEHFPPTWNSRAKDLLVHTLQNGSIVYLNDSATPTACPVFESGSRCECQTDSDCMIKFTPRSWNSGEGMLTGSFKFKSRTIDLLEISPPHAGTELRSFNESTVSVDMYPRITNSGRIFAKDTTDQALESTPFVVEISEGPGGASAGGYNHQCPENSRCPGGDPDKATSIKITDLNDLTIDGCGAVNCSLPCTLGVCTLTVNSKNGGDFVANTSFKYEISDGVYNSHIDGTSSVYFYPAPIPNSPPTLIVARGSLNNPISIARSPSAGYTHEENDPAVAWSYVAPAENTTIPPGDLTFGTCTGAGVCSGTYNAPSDLSYSTTATDLFQFDYNLSTNGEGHGSVPASTKVGWTPGKYKIEVFPEPELNGGQTTFTDYWVEGIGNLDQVGSGEPFVVKIRKNTHFTHLRNSNPKDVIVSNVVGGTFAGGSQTNPFTCAADTCSATFNPSGVSSSVSTAAANFDFKVVVEDKVKYEDFPSPTMNYRIVIMPHVKAPTVAQTNDIILKQALAGNKQQFIFGSTYVPGNSPPKYIGYRDFWTDQSSINVNVEFNGFPTKGPDNTGTLTNTGCVLGECSIEYESNSGKHFGTVNFQYRVNIKSSNPGLESRLTSTTPWIDAVIELEEYYQITGRSFVDEQKIVDGDVVPVTIVPLTIDLGASAGYTQVDNVRDMGAFEIIEMIPNEGTITDQSITNGVWTANYNTTNYGFGDFYFRYRVCKTNCADQNDLRSEESFDNAKAIHLYIEPKDIPPEVCTKVTGDSVVVYNTIPKQFDIWNTAPACQNGVWWTDNNNGDTLMNIRFQNAATILGVGDPLTVLKGVSGTGTACAMDGADVQCDCGTTECEFEFDPTGLNPDTSYNLMAKVETDSFFIPNMSSITDDWTQVTFKLVSPPDPEPTSLTVVMNEDTPVAVNIDPGAGYKTIAEINGTWLQAPDGYDMQASSIVIEPYSSTVIQDVTLSGSCTAGSCPISIVPIPDAYGVETILYRVIANGVTSSTTGSINITVNSVNDLPNTYANGRTHPDNAKNGNEAVIRREFSFWPEPEGAMYVDGAGEPFTLSFKPFNAGAISNWYSNPCPNCWMSLDFGYFDPDGDLAQNIEIHPDDWAALDPQLDSTDRTDAFPCDVGGLCQAVFTPNGTVVDDWLTFRYKVKTTDGLMGPSADGQPLWAEAKVRIETGDPWPAVAKHLPNASEENPDITEVAYPLGYTVPRNGNLTIVLQKGSTNAYTKNEFYDLDKSDVAQFIEIGMGVNGKPAPVNGVIDGASCDVDNVCTGGFACNSDGACVGTFKQNTILTEFPSEANFWYRVVANDTYTFPWNGNRDFGSSIRSVSEWKKVTLKVDVMSGVGCTDTPDTQYLRFVKRNLVQGESFTWNAGVPGGGVGNGYDHTGEGGLWRPLDNMEIISATGGTVSNIDCTTFNYCTADFTATGSDTPNDPSDDFVGHANMRIKFYDDWGCSSEENWYVNVVPRVAQRNICKFDYLGDNKCAREAADVYNVGVGDTIELEFKKKPAGHETSPSSDPSFFDYDGWEYMTWDNGNASKIRIHGFDAADFGLLETTGSITDAVVPQPGVTCNDVGGDLVCDVEDAACDAGGTCRISLKAHSKPTNDFGFVNFSFDAYASVTVDSTPTEFIQRGIIARDPTTYFHHSYNSDNLMFHQGLTSRFDVYVKTKPVPTNPTIVIGANEEVTLQIGREDDGYIGYTYADTENFAGKPIQINGFNVQNGALLASSFDQNTKVLTITFKPNFNFLSSDPTHGGMDYSVSVWDVMGDTGTIKFNVKQHHNPQSRLFNTARDTTLGVTLNEGTDFLKVGGHSYEPQSIEIVGSDLQPVDPAKGSIASATCSGTSCTFDFVPASGFVGQVGMKYRIKTGPGGSTDLWSIYADMTVDVLDVPTAPVVSDLNFTGVDKDPKLIAISSGSGYTDINNDNAQQLFWSNPVKGTVSPSSPITCDNGLCLVSFTALPTEWGNATFDFQVHDGTFVSSNTATVTVDFDPALTANDFTVNGSRNTNRVINFVHSSEYTYRPGSEADFVKAISISDGSIVEGLDTQIACSGGSCSLTYQPAADWSGTATLVYELIVDEAGTPKTSNQATTTIEVAATNSAAVAQDLSFSMIDHTQLVVTFDLGAEYTDLENDKGTNVLWSALRGGSIVGSNETCGGQCTVCNAAGQCSITFTPDDGFQGEAEFSYVVRQPDPNTTTVDSNVATVAIAVPADGDIDYELVWGAEPVLDSQCNIQVAGTVLSGGGNTCGDVACTAESATIDLNVASAGGVTGSYDGITGVFDGNTPGTWYTSWTVQAGATSVTHGRSLVLSEQSPDSVELPAQSLTVDHVSAMEGMQKPAGGCNGTSCNTSQYMGSIDSGTGFGCALMPDTKIKCWGANNLGQLGIGSGASTTPWATAQAVLNPFVPDVSAAKGSGFDAVSTGESHACALMFGRVACWGDNTYGQLGTNNNTAYPYPVFVKNEAGSGDLTDIVAISAGAHHTCAINTSREALCWGRNHHGQLGLGDQDGDTDLDALDKTNTTLPAKVQKLTDREDVGSLVTTQAAFDDVMMVSAGTDHTCMLRAEVTGGTTIDSTHVVCFGANDRNQLGDNDFLAADPAGTADDIGQFSKAFTDIVSTDDRVFPAAVRDSGNTPLSGVRSISAGDGYTCAIRDSGKVWCWGDNANQKAGADSGSANLTNPVEVKLNDSNDDFDGVVAMAAGKEHICFIREDKSAWCLGEFADNRLGNSGASADSRYPLSIDGVSQDAIAISAGGDHSCWLDESGTVSCVGSDVTEQSSGVSGATWRQCTKEYRLSTTP